LEQVVGRENRFEGEGELGGAVGVELGEAFFGFVYAREVADRNPPEGRDNRVKFFEPEIALRQHFCVGRFVDVVLERINGFPDGHVQEHATVFPGTEVSGIAGVGLEAPDEASGRIREGVEFVEAGDEAVHDGIIEFRFDAADVDLRDVVFGHKRLRGDEMLFAMR
jgi:hypothetical protein